MRRYFDEYVDYENLLFALDKSHRDHVVHSVWVMLLGLYLRKNFSPLANLDYAGVVPNFSPQEEEVEKAIRQTLDIVRQHEASLWCLIALTHDLGYPIQKTQSANEVMAKMVSNFGFLRQRDFEYGFTVVHQTAISELLNTVASVVAWLSLSKYRVGCLSGKRLDYAKSFEELGHGIMSAYLLQMYIDHICEAMVILHGLPEVAFYDYKQAAGQVVIITWLNAISAHTARNIYWSQLNSMPTLLFLCDELDEFSRYSHSVGSGEWTSMGCRTEFECTKGSIRVRYTFDNKDTGDDMELFFKSKVARLCNRFKLKGDNIRKLSVTCTDVRESSLVRFTYEKTLSMDPMGIVKMEPGGSSHDIQGFLDGNVNLSFK